MQPSVDGHTCCTDFMVVEEGGGVGVPRSFLEVKRRRMYTNLGAQEEPTAQALREAHILLEKMPAGAELLTNSMLWSFGVAQKAGKKIKVLNYFNIHLESLTEQAEVQQLLHALKEHFGR